MVLIISNSDDQSTNKVIDWMCYFGIKFIRLNDDSEFYIESIVISNSEVDFTIVIASNECDYRIKFSELFSVWYRRGSLKIRLPDNKQFIIDNPSYANLSLEIFRLEVNPTLTYILTMLASKFHINKYADNYTNKLYNLFAAKQFGISIPYTFISQYINKIRTKLDDNYEYISKSINDFYYININERKRTDSSILLQNKRVLGTKTELINKENVEWEIFEDIIYPSLVQEKLEKLFELRIFYLYGEFYSMAIFSQEDEKTKLDFRNYNLEDPNRTVPFLLPLELKNKLINLMKKIGLNCGSIDMVYTTAKEFVFLEVNPVGQFEQVSYPCNFYIEKHIANKLLFR